MALWQDLSDAAKAGIGALADGALWRALLREIFSAHTLAGVLLVLVVALPASLLVSTMLPAIVSAALQALFAAWLWPHVVRTLTAIVSGAVLAPVAVRAGRPALALPPVAEYRRWWVPLLLLRAVVVASLAPSAFMPYQLQRLIFVAYVALAILMVTAPLARSVLAPYVDRATVDAAIARKPWAWRLLAVLPVLAYAGMEMLLSARIGYYAFAFVTSALMGAQLGLLLLLGLLCVAVFLLLVLPVAVFALAAYGWHAAGRVLPGGV